MEADAAKHAEHVHQELASLKQQVRKLGSCFGTLDKSEAGIASLQVRRTCVERLKLPFAHICGVHDLGSL